jgi:hypothetical protein
VKEVTGKVRGYPLGGLRLFYRCLRMPRVIGHKGRE